MPTQAERRRRLLTRAVPLAVVALVAFVVGAAMGTPGSPGKAAAHRLAEAWAAGNYAAMYHELNDASRANVSAEKFAKDYREDRDIATLRGLVADGAGSPRTEHGQEVVPVGVHIKTVAFGSYEEAIDLHYRQRGSGWSAHPA